MFNSEWEQRSLFGWESAIEKLQGDDASQKRQKPSPEIADSEQPKQEKSLYCELCRKSFMNENVFEHHKKGKRHLKAQEMADK